MSEEYEVEYIKELIRKHGDRPVFWKQLQSMLSDANQRLRRKQYDEYFSSRK